MIGDHIIRLETVDSTNRHARDMLVDLPPEGTVVTADLQTAGRGRLDRRWNSAPGQNILASIILYPRRPLEEWGGLPLLSGLAVARAARLLAAVDAHVKWPNDVLVGNRKLSGILVESGRRDVRPWAILGIGINVNQTAFEGEYRLEPTSLALETGRQFDVSELLSTLCGECAALYAEWTAAGNAPIIAGWKSLARMLGRRIVVDEGDRRREGRAVDLGEDGSLTVEFTDGMIEQVFAGDVSIRDGENQR